MSILVENNTSFLINENYVSIIEKAVNESIIYINCPYKGEVSITFVNNEEIRELNNSYRGNDVPTDVLSFPQIDFDIPGDFSFLRKNLESFMNLETNELILGDIIISVDKLIEQAKEFNHSFERELVFLIVHSMLHLFGYDHISQEEEKMMLDIQKEILEKVGIRR